jgi:hypothetical protein
MLINDICVKGNLGVTELMVLKAKRVIKEIKLQETKEIREYKDNLVLKERRALTVPKDCMATKAIKGQRERTVKEETRETKEIKEEMEIRGKKVLKEAKETKEIQVSKAEKEQ